MDDDGKKLDNRRIDNKTKLKEVNDQLDIEKKRLKTLDDIEELFVSLNDNVSKCVDLLAKSIKGQNINKKLDYIEESNKINYIKSIDSINDDRENIKQNIKRLNSERDEYQERIRRENNETLKKEEKEKERDE